MSRVSKYAVLLCAIKVTLEDYKWQVKDSQERLKNMREDSPIYALEYGSLKEKERVIEILERWATINE